MKKILSTLCLVSGVFAESSITIIDQNSPEFLLGKQTKINMKFIPEDSSEMWLKVGVRVQGTLESKSTYYYPDANKKDTTIEDSYLRRVRLEVGAGFGEHISFSMDIRNDKSNYGIENTEGQFSVGDAYIKIKKPFGSSLVNFKLFRSKIDVSRTETVKSARVIAYDRPYVADAAAQYISFNRRGSNLQMYGDWEKKIHYQIAFGSASSPDKIIDAIGVKASSVIDITNQSFFYGGKVKLSPFDGWEEKSVTETYFGRGKHIGVGIGYWSVPSLEGTINGNSFDLNRRLLNIEVSAHYKGFFIQGEYFKFYDAVKEWNTTSNLEVSTSTGWYVTSEYVFDNFYYIAPFVRYEVWDRFEKEAGYDLDSTMLGLNWYLRGNTIKVGAYFQRDNYGKNTYKDIEKVSIFRLTSQFFF